MQGEVTRRLCRMLCAGLPLAALWLCLPRAAVAQPSAAELTFSWSAPPGCPSRAQLQAALARETHAAALLQPLHIAAQVERLRTGTFVVRLAFRGAIEADRELSEQSCEALAAASVWLSANVINDLARSTPEVPEAPPAADAARLEWAGWLFVDSASAPDLAFGPGIELALSLGALRLAVRPRLLSSWRNHDLSEVARSKLRTLLFEFPVQACYVLRASSLWAGVCASAVPGLVSASLRGDSGNAAALGGFVAAEAGLTGAVALSARSFAQAELGLLRPLWFPRLAVAPEGVVHEPAPLSLRAGFALGMRF